MDTTQKEAMPTDGFAHIVLYATNPSNPKAVGMIVQTANRLLAPILPKGNTLLAAPIPPSERAVGSNKFQVALTFIFASRALYDAYMKHPQHLEFVKFVLRGWMIKGSKAVDPEAEFIDHILNATPDTPPVKWARNPSIPEEEVVWNGEKVYDAYNP